MNNKLSLWTYIYGEGHFHKNCKPVCNFLALAHVVSFNINEVKCVTARHSTVVCSLQRFDIEIKITVCHHIICDQTLLKLLIQAWTINLIEFNTKCS